MTKPGEGRWITPPEYAQARGVKPDKVLGWIRSGASGRSTSRPAQLAGHDGGSALRRSRNSSKSERTPVGPPFPSDDRSESRSKA